MIKFVNLTYRQQIEIYQDMQNQCLGIAWVEKAFKEAWESFVADGWTYDGATFVQEYDGDFWEVAAFIHDWLNSIGYVGKKVDLYFIRLMIQLGYPENIIFERCKWMQWTWINVLNHKFIKRDFIANDLPVQLK